MDVQQAEHKTGGEGRAQKRINLGLRPHPFGQQFRATNGPHPLTDQNILPSDRLLPNYGEPTDPTTYPKLHAPNRTLITLDHPPPELPMCYPPILI
nr:hypothetical protein Q903MT_gene4702 [Picea sitchensis]